MELKIEKLVYGGDGIGYDSGATVFVPYVLPGETVIAAPVESKKKFVRARLEQVVSASAERVAAACPHFGVCGGCNYQHAPYEAQLAYKKEILRETLRRIGRVEWPGEICVHASPAWGYRNRAQWKVRPAKSSKAGDGAAAAASSGQAAIGYFEAGSMTLCPVTECGILSPLLQRTLAALRGALAQGGLPRELREVEVFADTADTRLLLTATFAGLPAKGGDHAAKFRALVPEIESLVLHDTSRDRMELDGPGFVTCEAAGEKFRVGHFSFFQVNRFLLDEMVRTVVEGEAGEVAYDLYCGVGLFSLPLARTFGRVVAVESNPAATRDLEANASAARNIEVRTADVERAADRAFNRAGGAVDLIVLDPPRAGLEPHAADALARSRAARITYVSCEPPTLARDLRVLLDGGYEILSIDLFDLFPQTFHMETVVKLRRRA